MRNFLFFVLFICFSEWMAAVGHADDALIGQIKQTKDIAMLRLGLRHAEARVRAASASRLGDLGERAIATIPLLIGMFADPVSQVRASAAFSLSQMGGAALAALREALVHPSENFRIGAASALSEMGQEAQEAFDALIKATQDPQALVRGYVIRTLGNIGPKSRLALLEIGRALHDPSSIVRRYAAEAIQKIGTPAIPLLLKMIEQAHQKALSTSQVAFPSLRTRPKQRRIAAIARPTRAVAAISHRTSPLRSRGLSSVRRVVALSDVQGAPKTKRDVAAPLKQHTGTVAVSKTQAGVSSKKPIGGAASLKKPMGAVVPLKKPMGATIWKPQGVVASPWVEPATSIAVDGDFAGWHTFGVQPLVYGAKQAKRLSPGQASPTAAILHFFASLLRKDGAYQDVLAPTMKPALREALKAQLPALTKDLQTVFLHAYIARSHAVHAKKDVTRRIAEGGEQLFGSYNILFFSEVDSNKNDVFLFLRKIEERWYIQGIIAPFVRDILRKTLRP